MAVQFTATKIRAEENGEHLRVGVATLEHEAYVMFQRSHPQGYVGDWGVYFEYEDSSHSGYDCVERCELTRGLLRVKLKELGTRGAGCEGLDDFDEFAIKLRVGGGDWGRLAAGLREVFIGFDSRLSIG